MALLLVLLALSPVEGQDPSVTLDRTASAGDQLADLVRATGASIRLVDGLDPAPFPVRVKGARFFEALDAVCRSHGNLTYVGREFSAPDGTIVLRPGAWVEYPTSYSGPYRVVLSETAQVHQRGPGGEPSWAWLHFVLFGPSWIAVSEAAAGEAKVVLKEVTGPDGADLLLPAGAPEPVQRVKVLHYPNLAHFGGGNAARESARVRAFDPDRPLRLVRGVLQLSIADLEDVVVPPIEGRVLDTPAGLLKVGPVREHSRGERGVTWRVPVTLEPKTKASKLAGLVLDRWAGDDGVWNNLWLPSEGLTVEVAVGPLPRLPDGIRLRVRKAAKPAEIPFEFRDVLPGGAK